MIRYEFGDGKSTFIFFKDRGGKENHKNVLFFFIYFSPFCVSTSRRLPPHHRLAGQTSGGACWAVCGALRFSD